MFLPKIEVIIDGQNYEASLLTEDAPKTCEAFLKHLPVETSVYHSAWSGDSVFFILTGPKASVNPPEENVSIYGAAGDIMWHPGESYQEFQIVHGYAQFRWKTGPLRSSIFARITGDLESLDDLAHKIQREGGKTISVRAKSG
jgi:cyclophilin family peptidyl-prolyl cis-trans isomerase